MRKIKIIYNPSSGRQVIQKNIPELIYILQKNNYYVDAFSTKKKYDATEEASKACKNNYDIIIAIGGDGTVNEIINGIMPNTHRPKLAIYPAGTINDFASFLKIPKSVEEFAKIIMEEKTTATDIGLGGDRYFLNVAAAGLLTDVAYKVSTEAKTVLGKFAYYLEGIKEFPRQIFNPIKVKMRIENLEQEREILFFLLTNSPFVGGFKYIAPDASINDGKFDLLIVERSQFIDVATIFIKVLTGNHTNHPNLQYIQVDSFSIESEEDINVDLDGELGGRLPMKFEVKKAAINIITP